MSRANRERRKRGQQRRLQPGVQERGQHSLLPPKTVVVPAPPGMEKMSEVFKAFLAPELKQAVDEPDMRALLKLGMLAWNASLLPPAEQETFLRKAEEALPADQRDGLESVLKPLMRRKEANFAEHRRLIVDFHLTIDASGAHLQVVSSLPGA